MEKGFI